jgi:Flp pilus assembly protein TadB
MRDLFFRVLVVWAIVATTAAVILLARTRRMRRRLKATRRELAAVVNVALAAGANQTIIIGYVTKRMAERGQAPFEVLRVLRGEVD